MYFSVKNATDVDLLLSNNVQESLILDYKRAMYISNLDNKEGKMAFLTDICAFANTRGGQIIVSIEEDKGAPVRIDDISGVAPDREKLKLRLLGIISTGIYPSIYGVQIDFIDHDTGLVLIITIPLSWNTPHWLSFESKHKFFGRNSGGNYELSHIEIKDKFNMNSTVEDKVKDFRKNRIEHFEKQEDIPIQLNDENRPKLIFHIMPLSSFFSNIECDVSKIKALYEEKMDFFKPLGASTYNIHEITIDGFLNYAPIQETPAFQVYRHMAYTHFHRSGVIEAVTNLKGVPDQTGETYISSAEYEGHLLNQKYLDILRALNFLPPFYIFISLLNVSGFKMAYRRRNTFGNELSAKAYSKDKILLREIVVESFDKSLPEILRPAFDRLFNAWGIENCHHFDDEGNYSSR